MATTSNDYPKKKQLTQQTANVQPVSVQNQNAAQKQQQTQSNGVLNSVSTINNESGNGYSVYQTPKYQAIDYSQRVSELGGGAYTPGQNVQSAQQYLQGILDSKPGAYQSQYSQQLNDLYNQIMNREDFSYDINGDALYQQYKDQYTQQGQLAMRDTMGQAAAMTGGYGSSYASAAGNQAYQSYLQQLNAVIPELYSQAYQRYVQQGQDLQNKYTLTQNADQMDYAKYRDTVGDWQTERGYAQSAYEGERSFDYNDYATQLNKAMNLLGYERDDSLMNFEYQRDDALRAENYGYQDYARDQEFSQQEKMFEKQAALEREMLATQQAYQDAVRQEGYTREDALRADDRSYNEQMLAAQREYEDALRKEGYAREDQLLADERGYSQQLRDDERAYNQYLTQDQRDYEAALRQEGYSREDQQLMQQQAYSVVMSMLTSGAMPTPELLALAQIGEADALAFAKKNGYSTGGRSGGGSKDDTNPNANSSGYNALSSISNVLGAGALKSYSDILGKATGGDYGKNLGSATGKYTEGSKISASGIASKIAEAASFANALRKMQKK